MACRWEPIVAREGHCTHYVYPAAWMKLGFWEWWRARRPVLMAAVPWHVTWREYVSRYLVLQGLDDALREVSDVGDRGAATHCGDRTGC